VVTQLLQFQGKVNRMHLYTQEQKEWLNNRYCETNQDGIYLAHQPVYGFREDPSEPNHTLRYLITYQILKSLNLLGFVSMLDAGGGEGYKGYLVKKLFGAQVIVSDLSENACLRSRDLFSLAAVSANLHDLPFRDKAFDVVLCSESLEHVKDVPKAVDELLRIARHALVITVPHEKLDDGSTTAPHGHINAFHLKSFSCLMERGILVRAYRILSPLITIPACLADAKRRTHNPAWRHPEFMTRIYNLLVPVAGRLLGCRAVAFLVRADGFLCKVIPTHNGILYVLLKSPSAIAATPRNKLRFKDIICSTVPLLKLSGRKVAAG
jgi:SAM-dependent methyltransferase